jgi:hypothetical protein
MYGLKPVPFKMYGLKPVPFGMYGLKPVPFKMYGLKPVPFNLKQLPFGLTCHSAPGKFFFKLCQHS